MTVVVLVVALLGVMVVPFTPYWLVLGAGLLVSHLNGSGTEFDSAASVGWVNSATILLVPLLLVARLGSVPRPHKLLAHPIIWATAVMVWVAIASVWSPFRLSAVKQVAFFAYQWVLVGVLVRVIRNSPRAAQHALIVFLLGGLGLGLLQTFSADGSFGQLEGRFTSFTGPQGFAISFVATVPVFLAMMGRKHRTLGLTVALALPVLVLQTGSRSATALAIMVAALAGIGALVEVAFRRRLTTPTLATITGIGLVLFLGAGWSASRVVDVRGAFDGSNRVAEAAELLGSGAGVSSLGTAAWRLGMYAATLEEIRRASPLVLMVGRGTSSAGSIVTTGTYSYRDYDELSVDANRIVHNELLRTMYEWGLIGIGFALLGLAFVGKRLVRIFQYEDSWVALLLCAAASSLLAFSMVENLFAGAGRPSGVAVASVIAAISVLGAPKRGRT